MDPHSHTFKLLFGILGNIIGVGVNLAPVKTFWYICKKRNSQGFSCLPYVFSLAAALIWVLYGLPSVTPDALPIITINVAGSTVQSVYILIFLIFSEKKPKMELMKVLSLCLMSVGILAVFTLFIISQDRRSLTVGSICVLIGVVTYASPLSVANAVVRTRSVKFLPIYLCVALFINSTVWTCYGFITSDRFVLIPNGVGVVFGVSQIALYAKYRNAQPLDVLPEKGQNGDAHKDTNGDKSFDKVDEKSVKGEFPPTPSQNGHHKNHQSPSFPSHESPGVVMNGHANNV